MIALVVAVEKAFDAYDQPLLSTNVAMNWRFGGKAARSKARECDVLCFGDSQVEFALLPRVIQARSGLRAYNLALYAGPPTASFYQLRAALNAGARPKAVVVDFQPNVLKMQPQGHARIWPELLSLRDALDLAWTCRDASLFAQIALGKLLASYRDRLEFRANVLAALRGIDPAGHAKLWLIPLWRNWKVNLGANVLPKNPNHGTELASGFQWLAPPAWTYRREPLLYMKRFLDLAAARGITVYWLLPPVHPVVRAERERRGLEEHYTQFVRRVQTRYPTLHVLDARDSGYGRQAFADLAHLDPDGAAALSADVAVILSRDLIGADPPARWVTLPPFRTPGQTPGVEDVNASRVALQIAP